VADEAFSDNGVVAVARGGELGEFAQGGTEEYCAVRLVVGQEQGKAVAGPGEGVFGTCEVALGAAAGVGDGLVGAAPPGKG